MSLDIQGNHSKLRKHLCNFFPPVLILLVYFIAVLTPGNEDGRRLLIEALSDAFHYPLSFILYCLIFITYPKKAISPQRRMAFASFITVVIACLTEIIQPLTGRSTSWTDLLNGVLGAIFGVCFTRLLLAQRKLRDCFLCIGFGFVCLIYVLIPAWQAYRLVKWQSDNFPLISDFESEKDLKLWKLYTINQSVPSKIVIRKGKAISGNHSLQIKANEASWVGISYVGEKFVWDFYNNFSFSVYNPSNPFKLSVRIDDKKAPNYDNRFNYSVLIEKGWNSINISLADIKNGVKGRGFDVNNIHRFLIFVGGSDLPVIFYIDNIRLE